MPKEAMVLRMDFCRWMMSTLRSSMRLRSNSSSPCSLLRNESLDELAEGLAQVLVGHARRVLQSGRKRTLK